MILCVVDISCMLKVHHNFEQRCFFILSGRNYRGDLELLGVFMKITIHTTGLYIRMGYGRRNGVGPWETHRVRQRTPTGSTDGQRTPTGSTDGQRGPQTVNGRRQGPQTASMIHGQPDYRSATTCSQQTATRPTGRWLQGPEPISTKIPWSCVHYRHIATTL